jgi:hypothetical protein
MRTDTTSTISRRNWLTIGIGGALGAWTPFGFLRKAEISQQSGEPPTFSVVPVVGDGQWIWNKPPEGPTGYLEPRSFDVSIGIELQGRGQATNLVATTTLPIECPEQKIESEQVRTQGCLAEIRRVGEQARQLVLRAPGIVAGQAVRATVKSTVTVCKQYHGYRQEMFPAEQSVPPAVRKLYLGNSPGIQTHSAEVRALYDELSQGHNHPWDLAARFAAWIPRNIRAHIGPFTGVLKALADRRGDCAEMSAMFVALCRAGGIPARLVWVPNHNWAEFYLTDQQGQGHWIPAHTACYFWFGWTGAHELVLQKGDRLQVPERKGYFRLLEDWAQWMGKRPAVRYPAELVPKPSAPGADAGPGCRSKIETGEWQVVGNHPLNRYVRR